MTSPDNHTCDEQRVWEVLHSVVDPEIPVISVVELGIIAAVAVSDQRVSVSLTPTFAACPAIELMKTRIEEAIGQAGFGEVEIKVVYDPPWTTERITPDGRAKLKQFGLTPPQHIGCRPVRPEDFDNVPCPFCDATDTTLDSTFGPTLCRAMHYCNACQQPFEYFKPVTLSIGVDD